MWNALEFIELLFYNASIPSAIAKVKAVFFWQGGARVLQISRRGIEDIACRVLASLVIVTTLRATTIIKALI